MPSWSATPPPPGLRGQAISRSATTSFGGQFASPLLFGPLIAATSIRTGFLTAAGVAVLVLLTLLGSRVPATSHPDTPDEHQQLLTTTTDKA